MKLLRCVLLLAGLVCSYRGYSQELPDIESLLENNDIQTTEEGYEEIVNSLLHFARFPLNMNTAGFDSLKMLFWLSDAQIDQLLEYREKYGNFLHLNELLLVTGIGRKDLENLLPFVTLGIMTAQERRISLKKRMRHELLTKGRINFPLQEGYKRYSPRDFAKERDYKRKIENRFHGPPLGTLIKYKWAMSNHLQVGITLENDPGEGYFSANQRTGFDFLSAHLRIATERWMRSCIVGDYRLQWGQGLIAWGGFASGKSDVAVGNEKSARGITPYTSTDENNYLRGVAFNLRPLPSFSADLFFSAKSTDGNLVSADTLSEEDYVSVSIYESGYHRNNAECKKKHALKELTTGLSLHWNTHRFKLGTNALYYNFTPALLPRGDVYQQYQDSGDNRWLISLDYKTSVRNIYLFGETAYSDQGAWATLNGLRWGIDWLSTSLLYRRYGKRYVSRYASGFGEFSNTSNEEGVYLGCYLTPVKNLKINLYYDWFHYFSPRYRATIPGYGKEVMGSVNYRHFICEHHLHIKYEVRPEDLKGKGSVRRKKAEYRYQLNCKLAKCWELRTRFSMSHYRKDASRERGYMVYEDVIYAARNAKLKMQYRLAWFNTTYQARIYAYENNVLYGYSFPFFNGEGWRTYLNLSWKPVRKLTCYLKAGLTIYPGIPSLSSGVTKVEGNKLCDVTLQLRISI